MVVFEKTREVSLGIELDHASRTRCAFEREAALGRACVS